MGGVLVGCCNKVVQAGQLLNNRKVFLAVMELGGLRQGAPAWSGSAENPLSVADC